MEDNSDAFNPTINNALEDNSDAVCESTNFRLRIGKLRKNCLSWPMAVCMRHHHIIILSESHTSIKFQDSESMGTDRAKLCGGAKGSPDRSEEAHVT